VPPPPPPPALSNDFTASKSSDRSRARAHVVFIAIVATAATAAAAAAVADGRFRPATGLPRFISTAGFPPWKLHFSFRPVLVAFLRPSLPSYFRRIFLNFMV